MKGALYAKMVSGDLRGAGSTPSLVNQVATYLVGSDSLIKDERRQMKLAIL